MSPPNDHYIRFVVGIFSYLHDYYFPLLAADLAKAERESLL
jgi:hypothetical protein